MPYQGLGLLGLGFRVEGLGSCFFGLRVMGFASLCSGEELVVSGFRVGFRI